MRRITKIFVHCSDSEDSLDIGFRDIDEWHRQNGWLSPSGISCGYHAIIRRDGTIEEGRPESESGAHVKGHNKNSLGICWVGRDKMDAKQLKSLKKRIRRWLNTYRISPLDVYGHCEMDGRKTCPNIDMDMLRAEVLFETEES